MHWLCYYASTHTVRKKTSASTMAYMAIYQTVTMVTCRIGMPPHIQTSNVLCRQLHAGLLSTLLSASAMERILLPTSCMLSWRFWLEQHPVQLSNQGAPVKYLASLSVNMAGISRYHCASRCCYSLIAVNCCSSFGGPLLVILNYLIWTAPTSLFFLCG